MMTYYRIIYTFANKLWVIIVSMLFIAIGCTDGCGCNGCTTSVVIDQEARKIKANGIKMKLTANKNRVTNRKLKLNQELYIDKTVWYSVDYDLKIEKRPEIKNICELDVPQNQDMEMALDKFNVRFSPDKKHFAVGLENKVYDFFHLFEDGVPFSSGCFYLKDSNYTFLQTANLEFNKINWKIFPDPEKLFDLIIVPNNYAAWALNCNKQNVLDLLNQMPPGNSHEKVLIEKWYCEIADLHFTRKRVEQLVKVSPEWKQIAIRNLIDEVNNSVSATDIQFTESLDMILWINEPLLLKNADSIVFNDYFAEAYAGNYLVERLKDSQIPLTSYIQAALLSEAKEKARNFKAENEKISADHAFEILLIFKEYALLKEFIESNIQPDFIVHNFTDLSFVTIRKYDKYPNELQKLMIDHYYEIAKSSDLGLSGFEITEVLEFLKNKIPCEDLKKIVELHKNNLVAFQLPKDC